MPRPKLLLSDIDGTLVTPDKQLTPAAVAAAGRLREAGIGLTVASSRPARGLAMIISALDLQLPVAGFNGGQLLDPLTGKTLSTEPLAAGTVEPVLETIQGHGLSAWVFDGQDWYVTDPEGPNVARERRTVGFDPIVVHRFPDGLGTAALKIVGTSNDHPAVAGAEAALQAKTGLPIAASRSQPYYLDITHPDANKGAVVRMLAARLGIDPQEIAVIGDAFNDVAMFRVAGTAIAMGNAVNDVQREATHVTSSNTEEGFANAVDWLLGVSEQ